MTFSLRLSTITYAKRIATNVVSPTSGQTLQTKNFTMKKFFSTSMTLFKSLPIFPNLDYSGLCTRTVRRSPTRALRRSPKSPENQKVGVFETDFKQVPFRFRQTTRTYSESWRPVEALGIRISEFISRYLDIFACGASKIAET